MKNKVLLMIAFILLSLVGFAQSGSGISGSVKDETDKALPNVTVYLVKALDSAVIKTAVTDAKGNY